MVLTLSDLNHDGDIVNYILKSSISVLLFLTILPVFRAQTVFAENIDPGDLGLKYAYGENIGWINFKPFQGPGVTVTPSAVTGLAWSENVGWINLAPTYGGVLNDGTGRLSGFAWGENVGWINFAPAGGGVFIDGQGLFSGKAWGENIGWISFSSTGPVAFGVAASPLALPLPSGTDVFTFPAVVLPVLNAQAANAEPLGVGEVAVGGGTLSLQLALDQFAGPADIYFLIYVPVMDANNIYQLTSSGTLQTLSAGLFPLHSNVTGPVRESIFGNIPASTLPHGQYFFGVFVTPSGDQSLTKFFLWVTSVKL